MLENKGSSLSDVYSLGATLSFCASGHHPSHGLADPVTELAKAQTLPLPKSLKDSALGDLVTKLTAHKPSARPSISDACDLLRALLASGTAAEPATLAGVCPVTRAPFGPAGDATPYILPCCYQNISLGGLQARLVVGPRTCPCCKMALPDKAAGEFAVNVVLSGMLAPPCPAPVVRFWCLS